MDWNDPDFLELRVELEELLQEAQEDLLLSESEGNLTKYYDQIFRVLHNAKGACGMFALTDIQEHLHQLESNFGTLKETNSFSEGQVQYFLLGIDHTLNLLNQRASEFDHSSWSKKSSTKTVASTQVNKENPGHIALKLKKEGLIILVDDEPDLLEIHKELLLENTEMDVITYECPQKFVEEFPDLKPTIIICDYKMPKLDGLEVLQKIRYFDPMVGFILLSGYLDKHTIINALNLKASTIIEKPLILSHLLTAIESQIRNQKLWLCLEEAIKLMMSQHSVITAQEFELQEEIKLDLKTRFSEILRLRQEIKITKNKKNSSKKTS